MSHEENELYQSKSIKNDQEEAISENDNDLPSEITFEKRSIPKQRTQSIQSVLSSVSLKSLGFQQSTHAINQSNRQPFIPPQQSSQPQFINTKTHIQAPAIAASSKRRASFEIGQRLPFHKEDNESDGDADTANDQDQKKLTEDALKKLSAFNKFQPAEVDYTITATSHNDVIASSNSEPRHIEDNGFTSHRSYSNSPELQRVNPNSHVLLRPSSHSTPSLAKRPITNPSSAAQKRDVKPLQSQIPQTLSPSTSQTKLLSTTTSSQNLVSLQQHSQTPTNPQPQHHSQPLSQSQSQSQTQTQSQSTRPSLEQQPSNSLQTLSDPRRPMYVPAVLRQSDTNLKPEDLKHINEQNSKKAKSVLTNAAQSLRSQTSHWKLSFEASSTNLPTRAHWRRDISRTTCAYCEKTFTFLERRHHCRRCGDIFCAEHTSHLLKLGLDAQFTIGGSGVLCKVCDNCCKDYEEFVKNKFGQNGKGIGNGKKLQSVSNGGKRLSVVDTNNTGSVPADWSWSSF